MGSIIPGYLQKTVRMIGGHLHNTRCMLIKKTGRYFDLAVQDHVDRYRVSRKQLISKLDFNSQNVLTLLEKELENERLLRGFSKDVVHSMTYRMAHEAHHRGQIIVAAR